MNGRHLIIDCDPGVDDALALLYAISSKRFKSLDILTVAGNVGINQTTANAIKLIALAHNAAKIDTIQGQIGLYKGCSLSLDNMRPTADSVHGRDGMGEVPLRLLGRDIHSPENTIKTVSDTKIRILQTIDAATHLVSLANESSQKHEICDLVCTGPLTNVATALNILGSNFHYKFWSRFDKVVIMGGSINVPGNVTPFAEFNFYADPMAAKTVLSSWQSFQKKFRHHNLHKKLLLVPLDVTQKVILMWEEIEAHKELSNFFGKNLRLPEKDSNEFIIHRFVSCMLQKYFLFHSIMANPVRYHKIPELSQDKNDNKQFYYRIPEKEVLSYRKHVSNKFKKKRLGGSSGLKYLPRFCYLHDPLAMHVAVSAAHNQNFLELFSEACIAVSLGPGDNRGMCKAVTSRPVPIESLTEEGFSTHSEGIIIHYLDPIKFIGDKTDGSLSVHEKEFKLSLLESIGISIH